MDKKFSVSNPFSDEKCNKKSKHHSKKNNIVKQEVKKVKNLKTDITKKEKPNSGNNISSLLNTIKNENSSKEKSTISNDNDNNNSNDNAESYSSDELPEASAVLSDSQLNNYKKEPSTKKPIKNNSILNFFNASNSNNKNKEKNDKNKNSNKNEYSKDNENSEEDSEFPNPNEALSKSIKKKLSSNLNSKKDKDKLKSIKDIKKSLSQNKEKEEFHINKKKTSNIKQNKFNFDNDETELPKSEDILSNSLEKHINNKGNDIDKNLNNEKKTGFASSKNIVNNTKMQKENKVDKNNEDLDPDLPKPNDILLKEMNKNKPKVNNEKK